MNAAPARSRPHFRAPLPSAASAEIGPAVAGTSASSGACASSGDGAGAVADASSRFVLTVRALTAAAHEMGLSAPSYQSPPTSSGLNRSIQRTSPGDFVVAVRVNNRPFAAVVADAIEGLVVGNELNGSAASCVRDKLWSAVADMDCGHFADAG